MSARNIAIIGFGNQGRAWAANLRDSGWSVQLLFREKNERSAEAEKLQFQTGLIHEELSKASVVALLIPDDAIPAFQKTYGSLLQTGQSLIFAHGYALHYRTASWPEGVNRILVAPKGIGTAVRQEYVRGSGVPAVLAIDHDVTGTAKDIGFAVADGIGAGRFGIFVATVRDEVEADLFSEQSLLCGGLPALVAHSFETLVDAGISPEVAYLECVHELKFIADLIQEKGIHGMLKFASSTARFGGLTASGELVSDDLKKRMRAILARIQNGEFQASLAAEAAEGFPTTEKAMASLAESCLEQIGKEVRR
jgi:ketol-acid reductoisomerase